MAPRRKHQKRSTCTPTAPEIGAPAPRASNSRRLLPTHSDENVASEAATAFDKIMALPGVTVATSVHHVAGKRARGGQPAAQRHEDRPLSESQIKLLEADAEIIGGISRIDKQRGFVICRRCNTRLRGATAEHRYSVKRHILKRCPVLKRSLSKLRHKAQQSVLEAFGHAPKRVKNLAVHIDRDVIDATDEQRNATPAPPETLSVETLPPNDVALTLLYMSTAHLGLSHRGFCEAYSDPMVNLRLQVGNIDRQKLSKDILPSAANLVRDFARKHFDLGNPVSLYIDSTMSQRYRGKHRNCTVVLGQTTSLDAPIVLAVDNCAGGGTAAYMLWLLAKTIFEYRIQMQNIACILSDNCSAVQSALAYLTRDTESAHGQGLRRSCTEAAARARSIRAAQPQPTAPQQRDIREFWDAANSIPVICDPEEEFPQISPHLLNQELIALLISQIQPGQVETGRCAGHTLALLVKHAYLGMPELKHLLSTSRRVFGGRARVAWRDRLKQAVGANPAPLVHPVSRWGAANSHGTYLFNHRAKTAQFLDEESRTARPTRDEDGDGEFLPLPAACGSMADSLRDESTLRLLRAVNLLTVQWARLIDGLQANTPRRSDLHAMWGLVDTVDASTERAGDRASAAFESLFADACASLGQPLSVDEAVGILKPSTAELGRLKAKLTKLHKGLCAKVQRNGVGMRSLLAALWTTHLETAGPHETADDWEYVSDAVTDYILRHSGQAGSPEQMRTATSGVRAELERWHGTSQEARERMAGVAVSSTRASARWWASERAKKLFPLISGACARFHSVLPTNAAAERAFSVLAARESNFRRFAAMSLATFQSELLIHSALCSYRSTLEHTVEQVLCAAPATSRRTKQHELDGAIQSLIDRKIDDALGSLPNGGKILSQPRNEATPGDAVPTATPKAYSESATAATQTATAPLSFQLVNSEYWDGEAAVEIPRDAWIEAMQRLVRRKFGKRHLLRHETLLRQFGNSACPLAVAGVVLGQEVKPQLVGLVAAIVSQGGVVKYLSPSDRVPSWAPWSVQKQRRRWNGRTLLEVQRQFVAGAEHIAYRLLTKVGVGLDADTLFSLFQLAGLRPQAFGLHNTPPVSEAIDAVNMRTLPGFHAIVVLCGGHFVAFKQLEGGKWFLGDSLPANDTLSATVQSAADILPIIHSYMRRDPIQLVLVPFNPAVIAAWAAQTAEAHYEHAIAQMRDWTQAILGKPAEIRAPVFFVDSRSAAAGDIEREVITEASVHIDSSSVAIAPSALQLAPEARLVQWLTANGWGDIKLLGRGAYGRVFRAVDRTDNVRALKWLPTSSPDEVLLEAQALRSFAGRKHLPQLIDCLCCDGLGSVIVMTFHPAEPITQLLRQGTPDFIRPYMRALLASLAEVHELDYMHRDVKFSNFLYDHTTRSGVLTDFGLASRNMTRQAKIRAAQDPLQRCMEISARRRRGASQSGHPSTPQLCSLDHAASVGTLGWRAPEVLIGSGDPSTAADVWAAGICMLSMLCNQPRLWSCNSNADNLLEIIKLVGTQQFAEAAMTCGKAVEEQPFQNPEFRAYHSFAESSLAEQFHIRSVHELSPNAVDLLQRMLQPSPQQRISAKDALAHPYFQGTDVTGKTVALSGGPVSSPAPSIIQANNGAGGAGEVLAAASLSPATSVPRLRIRDLTGESPTLEHVFVSRNDQLLHAALKKPKPVVEAAVAAAKLGRAKRFCGVCRSPFTEFDTHLDSPHHLQKISAAGGAAHLLAAAVTSEPPHKVSDDTEPYL